MKIIGLIAIIGAILAGLWYFHIIEAPAAKAYRQYRKAAVTTQAQQTPPAGTEVPSLIDTKLKITKMVKTPTSATIDATEITRWLPPNAGGANFATIETTQLQAVVQKQASGWTVVSETAVSHNISTYEDRK
ncbi:MAG TPA: hypothetical protein PLQ76_00795 [bacterium]|nr:hypothetical protein [bacterium]